MITSFGTSEPFDYAMQALQAYVAGSMRKRIQGVVLYGSGARGSLVPGWSDLDVLLSITKGMSIGREEMEQIAGRIFRSTGVVLDICLVEEGELSRRVCRVGAVNSMVLNALSGRPDCALLVSGSVELLKPPRALEARNAWSYLNYCLGRLGEFRDATSRRCSSKQRLARFIRLSSSFLRVWLRARGINVPPYEPTIDSLRAIAPIPSLDFFEELFDARLRWQKITDFSALSLLQDGGGAFEAAANVLVKTLQEEFPVKPNENDLRSEYIRGCD